MRSTFIFRKIWENEYDVWEEVIKKQPIFGKRNWKWEWALSFHGTSVVC